MIRLRYPAVVLAFCAIPSALGEEPAVDNRRYGGAVSLYFENDTFVGTDRNYTSGVKIGWSSADLTDFSQTPASAPFRPVLDVMPGINEPKWQKNLLLGVGQNIYTPNNTETNALILDDRPYAGWLYLSVGIVWKNAHVRNTVAFDLGVVGPWALGEETQHFVHDLIGTDHPNGWDNQLHNEFGFVGTYECTWRWPKHERRSGLDWELLPHAGFAVGNVATYANLGGELRLGFNLPDDFGTSQISTATVTPTPVDGLMAVPKSAFGTHLFLRADGRAVAHNIFLDGNTFKDSHSVDRKILVADLSAGLAMHYKNFSVAYAFVFRTKEFRGQEDEQVFGTISLSFAY